MVFNTLKEQWVKRSRDRGSQDLVPNVATLVRCLLISFTPLLLQVAPNY